MKSRKGFTLIELMVVVLIVGILAAVAIPILRGRIDAAKWSEGKAMLGSLATAIRAYAAEKGTNGTDPATADIFTTTGLGFAAGDLSGTYFLDADFSITSCDISASPITFIIRCDVGAGADAPSNPSAYTLNQAGVWTAIP
jgi:prepilin-type N-terminal cleavage/methylation domain-containing protein